MIDYDFKEQIKKKIPYTYIEQLAIDLYESCKGAMDKCQELFVNSNWEDLSNNMKNIYLTQAYILSEQYDIDKKDIISSYDSLTGNIEEHYGKPEIGFVDESGNVRTKFPVYNDIP